MATNKITLICKKIIPILILFGASLTSIGSSPLYRTNPWVDSNAMLTMGRSLLHGLIPFKDIIEQRGPFLYAIYAGAAAIKETSFLGLFILQVFNLFIIYWISYKIAKDLKPVFLSPEWIALLGPLALISTSSFSFSGAPEEFAFGSILYLLYILNHWHYNVLEIPLSSFFLLGLNLSLVFWNKYSLIGTFVFFFIWVAGAFLYNRQFLKLCQVICFSVLGFLSISSIIILFFTVNGAFLDLIHIYFVQNMTAYKRTGGSMLANSWQFLYLIAKSIRTHYIVVIIIILGWLKAIYHKIDMKIELVMLLGTLIFLAMPHWVINYYNLIWMPFFAMGMMRIASSGFVDQGENYISRFSFQFLFASALFILPFINNQDLSHLVIRGEVQAIHGNKYLAQPMLSKQMHNSLPKGKIPSLIVINNLDPGFYLTTQTLPTTRYWHRMNMKYNQLPAMYQSFENTMAHKKVDFVIVGLHVQPKKQVHELSRQIENAIDPSLRRTLWKNYKIKMVSQNAQDESYIVLMKSSN
ncbi:teichoic acid glycosyl transferase [Leuconostoc carnosum]|uniref:Putative teichoic acid/polysaccharide glycosyl transferase n=2 Tax=Leuconostoc carnosum TaxID=1252 RepID=K0D9J2_LEUCJ|nr:putative teichoic acid/polysaccharide glycosyl transferase [Leuconostoc carnosum JB16]KAA8330471.1 teichoic acid glycosyl transferase [Leuconostoc carnosum]KAA8374492.1 teichoic acid glycosyl transferase [Leuconostoc carnosum]